MAVETISSRVSDQSPSNIINVKEIALAMRNGVVVAVIMVVLALIFDNIIGSIVAAVQVEEHFTATVAWALTTLLPFGAYVAVGGAVRHLAQQQTFQAIFTAISAMLIVFVVVIALQFVQGVGAFGDSPSLQFTLSDVENGARIDALVPGGTADEAGLQVGDVITAIRRDPVTRSDLLSRISQSGIGDPLRLRYIRDGEEMQTTVRVAADSSLNPNAIIVQFMIATFVTIVAIFWPGHWTPYVLLVLLLTPILVGYAWLIIATISNRTHGLLPVDGEGNFGGFTLNNWRFVFDPPTGFNANIWELTLNTFIVAAVMTFLVLLVSSMAGYALSRMHFAGRKIFLSFTLILHGFPAVTLLISIFFVLRIIGTVPIIGDLFGFNTLGGVALVMVAFQLPLGVWLMKGFFDNVPWDMERSALIDGASRWRVYWEIILPQIRPGLLALGIFAFISGWSAYLIPATYTVGTGTSTLAVFLRAFSDEMSPVGRNAVAAVGLFQLIPVMIFFIFAQEYLLNIYAGGSKGSS